MSTPEGPRRVRVTSPRTSAARRPIIPTGTREIDEQTRLGEIYMHSLIQSQLRLALAVIGGVLRSSSAACRCCSGWSRRPARCPSSACRCPGCCSASRSIPWCYGAARIYVRKAERIEAEFTEFVGTALRCPRR